jgi:hypothetical protein
LDLSHLSQKSIVDFTLTKHTAKMWQLPWILALSFILFEGTTAFAPNYPQHSDNERAMTRTRLLSAGISDISEGESTPSRRELLQWGGAALSSYILGVPGLPAAAEGAPKNILLTGSNSVSGIGFQAALRLAKAGHNLILPARSLEKSKNTVEKLKTLSTEPITGSLLAAECNLASMASISTFVAKLPQLLGEGQMLDTVCLNAGLARNTDATDVLRTEEGFELTGMIGDKRRCFVLICLMRQRHRLCSIRSWDKPFWPLLSTSFASAKSPAK